MSLLCGILHKVLQQCALARGRSMMLT